MLEIPGRGSHEFLRPGMLGKVPGGTLHGRPFNDPILLAGGVFPRIPIGMVVLPQVLSPRVGSIG